MPQIESPTLYYYRHKMMHKSFGLLTALLCFVLMDTVSKSRAQSVGSPYGSNANHMQGQGFGEPIMPINAAAFGQSAQMGNSPQMMMQRLNYYGQPIQPAGMVGGSSPQDFLQQQMLMQMYQQQQQRYRAN